MEQNHRQLVAEVGQKRQRREVLGPLLDKRPRNESGDKVSLLHQPCDYFEEYLQSQLEVADDQGDSEHEGEGYAERIRNIFRPDFARYTLKSAKKPLN